MAFTVQEFHDLVALLTQHPEWQAELRRLVLTEELLALPQIVHDLAEAQQRTERQIVRLQDDVGELKGIVLEERYRNRAFAYFSRLVRRTHALMEDELVALLEEAVARGALSEEG